MKNLKNFIGEQAYNIIKNFAFDDEAIRKALITPKNARAVFSELTECETKALCVEISNSGAIGQIRNTTQAEIIDAFNFAGYVTVIFDDETAISECQKYYRRREVICTYNNLQSRMREYHMLVAIKANIDKIERSENPQRDDEYGTSILNIQIARNGSHMSIKNRYNHTVSQPDSTLNNNLDMLYPGLQSMVLGYYGFASLNNTKSHYNNIVNIGGVYLKYHTERNNIYYGAFILDGVNGARFTDTSRYYVTTGADSDNYYRTPLVLDFKEKKAIDVSKDKENRNGKAILLSTAMSNGILTSINKERADTLSAVFKDAKRELLKCNKNALKYVHEVYGYDFTKPYKVTGILGKFTVKSIEKETGCNKGILLVYTRGKMTVCEMTDGRFYAKDLRGAYEYSIDKFYSQGGFETVRKSGNTATYVIQQEKQYIGNPKPEERKSYYYGKPSPELDKSGYDVARTRWELSRRLADYKTEKRVAEVAQVDYTQDMIEITKLFAEFKTELMVKLTNAKISEDYKKLENVVSYKLTWLVRDIENVKNHVAEKSFKSVESAQNMINDIKTRIIELRKKCL